MLELQLVLQLRYVDRVVYEDRDALALERVLVQVPFQHALLVNQ